MPSTVHVAYTASVNPSGASPILTRPQLWQGLQRKVRRAQDFVPVIGGCKVLEEKDDGREITRETYFKEKTENGQHVPGQEGKTVREVCKLYGTVKVDFHQPSGALIQNVVSDGTSLQPNDLNMTYVFEWRRPDIEAGSQQEKDLIEEHRKGAKLAVDMTLKTMRGMAERGEL